MTSERDEVDEIVDAWRRERADLDVTPLEILSRIERLSRLLDQARGAAFADHQLERWEFDVLSALRRAGEPYELSPRELIRQTLVTSGTMTNRVDRLEQKGLVRRRPDPQDRRGVRVRLTARGKQAVDGAMADLLEREAELLGRMRSSERRGLAASLRSLLSTLERG